MIFGALLAVISGFSKPLGAYILGEMTDSFKPKDGKIDPDDVLRSAATQAIYYIILGVCAFFCSWISLSCWMIAGERQSIRIRKEYFKALLR